MLCLVWMLYCAHTSAFQSWLNDSVLFEQTKILKDSFYSSVSLRDWEGLKKRKYVKKSVGVKKEEEKKEKRNGKLKQKLKYVKNKRRKTEEKKFRFEQKR